MKQLLISFVMLVAVSGGAYVARPYVHRVQRSANESQAIADLRELAAAEKKFQAQYGISQPSFTTPGALADPQSAGLRSGPMLHPRFRNEIRNGYRFEFKGSEYKNSVARSGLPILYGYVFAASPLIPDTTGTRTFAFYSETSNIHVRADGRLPTTEDEKVETK